MFGLPGQTSYDWVEKQSKNTHPHEALDETADRERCFDLRGPHQCRHWSRHMEKASFIPHAWVANAGRANARYWMNVDVQQCQYLRVVPRVHRLASDDVAKLSNAWQRGKLVLNKESVPYKSMLGEKSLTWRSSLFLLREVRTVLATPSLLSASHFKRYWDWTSSGPFFGRSTISQHAFVWDAIFV